MAIGGAIGELPPGVVYLPKPWQPLNVFIIAEQALSSSRGYRSALWSLMQAVGGGSRGPSSKFYCRGTDLLAPCMKAWISSKLRRPSLFASIPLNIRS